MIASLPNSVTASIDLHPWVTSLEAAIAAAEEAELALAFQGESSTSRQRKETGSYYTPADVAEHFWELFFRHHEISDLRALLAFISSNEFVEPSAGSGMFIFTFLKKAASLGATPHCLLGLRFHVIDINLAALRFFSDSLHEVERACGVRFQGIGPAQHDFLEWARNAAVRNAVFVGNPPFVTNARGSRWRNLYADFVAAMLNYEASRGLSLILPLSICFSRDYIDLRAMIRSAGIGISISSYDNIPDCLFKSGKPESVNTNRANSQRCVILNVGGPDAALREATPLQSWTAAERRSFLSTLPAFRPFSDADASGQFPRPATDPITDYMAQVASARPLRSFLSSVGRPAFSVGAVARNYIGIRNYKESDRGCIPIKVASAEDQWLLLHVLCSRLFFDYWRTYGDGFHVTVDLIERFPITNKLEQQARAASGRAREMWENRQDYAKQKLNSGQMILSYDFRSAVQ